VYRQHFSKSGLDSQIFFLGQHHSVKASPDVANRYPFVFGVNTILNSRKIAIKVAMSMKRQGLSRQDVADRMGCSPQYISKLLKGEENLSLETICKLEDALNIAILQYEFA
jgi:ribosome-binding protein aMBF1 (putative translation factor)